MRLKLISVIAILMFLLFSLSLADGNKPFLSNLSATKDSPIYTTYAAAMERSEFTLDEGYHLVLNDTSRGADFITDTGGDLCLAFKKDASFVYKLNDLSAEPIVTVNYPDLVKYYYYPFKNLRVDAAFVVHSSHEAFWDLELNNTGESVIEFQIIPFLQNNYRVYNDVAFHSEKNAISFSHEELPDGWVLGHDIPYVNPVRDVLLISEKPSRMTSYRSYKWGQVTIPQEIDLEKKPQYVVWGKLSHPNGERCRHKDPAPEIVVTLKNDTTQILTGTAPRWGSADENITPYGFYGIEMGNFRNLKDGDVYTIRFICRETGESATLTDTVKNMEKENMVRRDLELKHHDWIQTATGIGRDIWGSGTEMRLFWKKVDTSLTYNIYRRDYRQGGTYQLVAANLDKDFYTDKNIQGDQVYGYVVVAVDEDGNKSMPTSEINNIAGSDFLTDIRYPDQLKNDVRDLCRVIAMPTQITLAPGAVKNLRIVRAVSRMDKTPEALISEADTVLNINVNKYVAENEQMFSAIPHLNFTDPEKEMLYYSAFSLMRQVMLPPEGKSSYNYYVFSREPSWGWGHGGQVFHESLTMLAYAYMNPVSAMNSQRVYEERQHKDGYINYRTGSYLDETIPTNGQLTTSAPWYAWQNWEIYKITKDHKFLNDMYESSKKFYNYYVANRDSDNDGLCEWGAHAVLESVRDALVAVWDEVGWPSNFEGLDLNCMLVLEAKSLESMAKELSLQNEARQWADDAAKRKKKINETMWDAETGFYYNVDKKDNDFTFKKTNDLKRQEIIGFLPLWAGVASKSQAEILVKKLTDSSKFWREYGVPSLSADDPYYNPTGYWNGPVWVEWDYLIEHG
ncbi:MAG: trehalase family glycosidase, partial [Calditrichia bacterium]